MSCLRQDLLGIVLSEVAVQNGPSYAMNAQTTRCFVGLRIFVSLPAGRHGMKLSKALIFLIIAILSPVIHAYRAGEVPLVKYERNPSNKNVPRLTTAALFLYLQ